MFFQDQKILRQQRAMLTLLGASLSYYRERERPVPRAQALFLDSMARKAFVLYPQNTVFLLLEHESVLKDRQLRQTAAFLCTRLAKKLAGNGTQRGLDLLASCYVFFSDEILKDIPSHGRPTEGTASYNYLKAIQRFGHALTKDKELKGKTRDEKQVAFMRAASVCDVFAWKTHYEPLREQILSLKREFLDRFYAPEPEAPRLKLLRGTAPMPPATTEMTAVPFEKAALGC